MKNTKRIFTLVFSICLILSMMVTAYAAVNIEDTAMYFPFYYLDDDGDEMFGMYGSDYERGTVTTPSGSDVDVIYVFYDYDNSEYVEGMARLNARNHPNASLIEDASVLYNCHGYAWHMWDGGSDCHVEDPSIYISDGSYTEVSTPSYGDVICYYSSSGSIVHSGIVLSRMSGSSNGECGDANLNVVRSKWGNEGLYEHMGDDCPYVASGEASYVKYYRLHTNHNMSIIQATSIHYHSYVCSQCVYSTTEAHTWVQIGSQYVCSICDYTSNFIPINPSNVPADVWSRLIAATVSAEDGTVIFVDNMQFCFMNGQFYQVVECSPDVVISPELTE